MVIPLVDDADEVLGHPECRMSPTPVKLNLSLLNLDGGFYCAADCLRRTWPFILIVDYVRAVRSNPSDVSLRNGSGFQLIITTDED